MLAKKGLIKIVSNSVIKHNAIIYCSLAVMVFVYLYQIYSQHIRERFVLNNYLEIVVISILCGIFSYLFLYASSLMLKKYKENKVNSTEVSEFSFDIEEIENDFNKITNSVHGIVVEHINLPDFDSDLVDNMGEKTIRLWRVSCMAYAYGLLLIYLVRKNPHFMRTEEYDSFQNLVLHKIAKFRNKLALEFEDETVTNQELTSNTIEMILTVTKIINNKNCLNVKNENLLLEELNNYLESSFNYGKTDFSVDVKEYSTVLLKQLDVKVRHI